MDTKFFFKGEDNKFTLLSKNVNFNFFAATLLAILQGNSLPNEDDYNEGSSDTPITNTFTIHGDLVNNNKVYSGFSSTNYITIDNFTKFPTDKINEMKLTFTTGDDIDTAQCLVGIITDDERNAINIQNGKLYIVLKTYGSYESSGWHEVGSLEANTEYTIFIKAVKNKTIEVYDEDITIYGIEETLCAIEDLSIGRGYTSGDSGERYGFKGSIDLNKTYIK